MKARPFLYALTSASLIACANGAAVVLVGTGNGALVANGTTKIDITDPENDDLVSTTEW